MFTNLLRLPSYVRFVEDGGDNGGTGTTPPAAPATPPAEAPATPPAEPTAKTFTQEDLDRIVEERLARDRKARAPKPSDVPKAKAKADEDNDGEPTELERRLAELEAERDADRAAREAAEAQATRATVAEAKAVPAAILAGPADGTKEALETWADQLNEWRSAAPKRGPSSSALGRTNGTAATEAPVAPGVARIRNAYANSGK